MTSKHTLIEMLEKARELVQQGRQLSAEDQLEEVTHEARATLERLATVTASAAAVVKTAPRVVSRAGGDFGEAWDALHCALEQVDVLDIGGTVGAGIELEERAAAPPEPTQSEVLGAALGANMGLVMGQAILVDRLVGQTGNEQLAVAWGALLQSLTTA